MTRFSILLPAVMVAFTAASYSVAHAGCGAFEHFDRGGKGVGIGNNETVKFLPEGSATLRQINGTFKPELQNKVSHVAVSDDCEAIVYGVGQGAPGHRRYTGHSNLPGDLNDKVGAIDCRCKVADKVKPSKEEILKLVGSTWSGSWDWSHDDGRGDSEVRLEGDGRLYYSYANGALEGNFEGTMGHGGADPSQPIAMTITLPDGNEIRFQWTTLNKVDAEFWEKGKRAGQRRNNPAQTTAVLVRMAD